MAIAFSHGFVLWAVPRFRRADGLVHDARNLKQVDLVPKSGNPVGCAFESIVFEPKDSEMPTENIEIPDCLGRDRCAYH